jgi:hypothetical protein
MQDFKAIDMKQRFIGHGNLSGKRCDAHFLGPTTGMLLHYEFMFRIKVMFYGQQECVMVEVGNVFKFVSKRLIKNVEKENLGFS